MSIRLNRWGYHKLIKEDLEWLMKQPRSLERDHIAMILEKAVEYECGEEAATEVRLFEELSKKELI